jgi:hypothetical protein
VGTATWFRVDHATRSMNTEAQQNQVPLIMEQQNRDDLSWQYSLRSNLLLWGCLQSAYLLYIGEVRFLLGTFSAISVLNIVTDHFYKYEQAAVFHKAKKGHLFAGIILWTLTILYVRMA